MTPNGVAGRGPDGGGHRWSCTTFGRRVVAGLAALAAAILFALGPGSEPSVGPLRPLVVDPNTAPPAVLEALPRLGTVLTARIVAARAEAPFRSIGDLDRRVRGVGPATVAALRPHLRFDAGGDPVPDPRTHQGGPPPRGR